MGRQNNAPKDINNNDDTIIFLQKRTGHKHLRCKAITVRRWHYLIRKVKGNVPIQLKKKEQVPRTVLPILQLSVPDPIKIKDVSRFLVGREWNRELLPVYVMFWFVHSL